MPPSASQRLAQTGLLIGCLLGYVIRSPAAAGCDVEAFVSVSSTNSPLYILGTNTAGFVFRLSGATGAQIGVTYGGTATVGVDVESLPTSVVISGGQGTVTVRPKAQYPYTVKTLTVTITDTGHPCVFGTGGSATITLVPLVINPQPQDQTQQVGATASFTPSITTTGTFCCQWRKEGYAIDGATNAIYVITNVQFCDAGAFTLVASNSLCCATSRVARLTVSPYSPVTSILLFHDSTLSSPHGAALGNLGLSYQLFTDDASFATALTNANAPATLAVIDAVDWTHDFSALASFINRGGRAVLEYWNLGAGAVADAFQVTIGSTLYSPPPVYDWGGSFLEGVSSPLWLYDLANTDGHTLHPADNAYAVAGFVSNPTANQAAVVIGNTNRSIVNGFLAEETCPYGGFLCGGGDRFAQNEIQFLLVPPPLPPVITFEPQDQVGKMNQDSSFVVLANGSGCLRYQWFLNQTNSLSCATNATLCLTNVQASSAGNYSVVVSNLFGTASSRLATLTIGNAPIPLEIRQLEGAVVLTWSNPSFSLQAAPTAAGVYTNVTGATAPYTNALTGPQQYFRLLSN